jgi:hypothetical protein
MAHKIAKRNPPSELEQQAKKKSKKGKEKVVEEEEEEQHTADPLQERIKHFINNFSAKELKAQCQKAKISYCESNPSPYVSY